MIRATLYITMQGFVACIMFALASSGVLWFFGSDLIQFTFHSIFGKNLNFIYFIKLNFLFFWALYWIEKIWNYPAVESLVNLIETFLNFNGGGEK